MRIVAILMFVVLLGTCISCGVSGTTEESIESSEANSEHEALTVANQVLDAIHNEDPDAIRPFLNSNNRDNLSNEEIVGFMKESKEHLDGVKTASELREGRSEGTVFAKIREDGDEVFVVVLTLEDGKYLFEDINSPPKESYDGLSKIE